MKIDNPNEEKAYSLSYFKLSECIMNMLNPGTNIILPRFEEKDELKFLPKEHSFSIHLDFAKEPSILMNKYFVRQSRSIELGRISLSSMFSAYFLETMISLWRYIATEIEENILAHSFEGDDPEFVLFSIPIKPIRYMPENEYDWQVTKVNNIFYTLSLLKENWDANVYIETYLGVALFSLDYKND